MNRTRFTVGAATAERTIPTCSASLRRRRRASTPTSGWQLTDAQAINARGQITGGGLINGEFHAFLMTPVH